ncbi:MAG: uracil-DNA glycosylase [Legionellales bacterium]|nr:uracil-DNA glycosylase [Legionellales bacterium]
MQHYYLEKMGITAWVKREDRHAVSALQCLKETVSACTRCPLHRTRTQTVFARGNPQAKLMLIGDAPDIYEDQQGTPIVGAAGSLLDKMLTSIGLDHDQIYMTNLLKCHPPSHRDPQLNELAQCTDYLTQQIALIKPKFLLALGCFSGQYLLNTTQSLNEMRTHIHHYQDIPVMVTYHPTDLLKNPGDKKKAYQDWLTATRSLDEALA